MAPKHISQTDIWWSDWDRVYLLIWNRYGLTPSLTSLSYWFLPNLVSKLVFYLRVGACQLMLPTGFAPWYKFTQIGIPHKDDCEPWFETLVNRVSGYLLIFRILDLMCILYPHMEGTCLTFYHVGCIIRNDSPGALDEIYRDPICAQNAIYELLK